MSEVDCTLALPKNATKKNGLSIIKKELEREKNDDFISPTTQFACDSHIAMSIGMTLFEGIHGQNHRSL